MEAANTKALLEKWKNDYPTACHILVNALEAVDKQLENEYIPVDMIVEFHQALANDIIAEVQSDTNNKELVQIRFDKLNLLMKFHWAGKECIKLNDHYNGAYTNCKCIDTDTEHKFKPNDICLIPAKFEQHQRR